MRDLKVNDKTIFSVDYRSTPYSCGTIERPNGSFVLIQHECCKPEVLDGEFEDILHVEYDFGVEYEKANEEVIRILKREGVDLVYDYHLGMQHNIGSAYIELDTFAALTRFYY